MDNKENGFLNSVLSDLSIKDEKSGIIGGYCGEGFPFFYADDAMVAMMGYDSVQDLIDGTGGLVANMVHPDDMAQALRDLGSNCYEGMTYKTTCRVPKKDGNWFWTVNRGKVIKTEDGRLAIVANCTDMTDFIARHERLEQQNLLSTYAFENMPGGYHCCDPTPGMGYPFLHIGKHFLEILGWTREEILIKFDNKFVNLIHPDDVDRIITCTHDAVKSSESVKHSDLVYRLLGKDGYHWITDSSALVEKDGRKFLQGIISDITPFMTRDILMRELCMSYAAFYAINLKEGTFENFRVNDYLKGQYGHTFMSGNYLATLRFYVEHEVIPQDQKNFAPVDSIEKLRKIFETTNEYYFSYRVMRDDRILYFRCSLIRSQAEPDWAIFAFNNVNQIIEDERRRAKENEIKNEIIEGLGSEYYSVILVDCAADTVTIYRQGGADGKDIADCFLKYDGSWTRGLAGYARDWITDASRAEVLEKLSLPYLTSHKQAYSLVYEKITRHGTAFLEVRVTFVERNSGEGVVVVGTRSVDAMIKKERLQEKALQEAVDRAEAANRAKDTFLNNMSHDIRTPMNAILGYMQLLENNLDDREKCQDYIAKVKNSSDYLLSLLNNVLEITRIESGHEHLNELPNDMGRFLRQFVDVCEGMILQRKLRFIHQLDIKTSHIYFDAVKVEEILLNLLSNAVKYTPDGGTITLKMQELPSDRPGYVTIKTTVSDTGIGMNAEFLPKLYEQFTREHYPTDGSRVIGTGLGLAIVKKLVDIMGGTIQVDTTPGQGTTFVVTTTFRIAEGHEPAEDSQPEDYDFEGMRILLAEDNELNTEIAMELLKEVGFQIDHAADGVECVDMLSKAPDNYYSIILMDILMPNRNGYEATHIIRMLPDEAKRNIPIIAMTANAFEEDRQRAIEAGMDGHVGKPINMPKLLEAIAEVLGKRN